MIRVIFLFLILLASVWLGIQLHNHPGYLLIAVNNWTIESTLGVAIIGLAITFFVLHAVLVSINWVAHIPTTWHNYLAKHRSQSAQAKTRQGLIEFSEGHWRQAKKHLINALPNADTPLLNYLIAARAAQEMGDSKLRDDYLREAQQSMPEAKIAVELTQAQLQLANRQWEQALATLRHLQDLAPHHPYVLKLLMNLYEEVKDWPQLIVLLPELKRNHVVSEPAFHQLEKQAYLQATIDLIKQDQSAALTDRIKSLPKHLVNDTDVMAEYSRYLLQKKEYVAAESQLRHCLSKQFDTQLIDLYGQIGGHIAQLKFAESFLKAQPHSAALNLCLGRICQSSNLWGKAKHYFEKSIELNPSSAAYAELGKLLEQLDDQAGACVAYREGLAHKES